MLKWSIYGDLKKWLIYEFFGKFTLKSYKLYVKCVQPIQHLSCCLLSEIILFCILCNIQCRSVVWEGKANIRYGPVICTVCYGSNDILCPKNNPRVHQITTDPGTLWSQSEEEEEEFKRELPLCCPPPPPSCGGLVLLGQVWPSCATKCLL